MLAKVVRYFSALAKSFSPMASFAGPIIGQFLVFLLAIGDLLDRLFEVVHRQVILLDRPKTLAQINQAHAPLARVVLGDLILLDRLADGRLSTGIAGPAHSGR